MQLYKATAKPAACISYKKIRGDSNEFPITSNSWTRPDEPCVN